MLTTFKINDGKSGKLLRRVSKNYPAIPAIPSWAELLVFNKPVEVKRCRKKTKEYRMGYRQCRCGCKKTFDKSEMVYVGSLDAKRKNTFYHRLCAERLGRT